MIRRSVVIVGAGPAGMTAAIALCQAGVRPMVIDENHQIGGQIYRVPPGTSAPESFDVATKTTARGNELRQQFEQLGDKVELVRDTTVWGVFPPRRLAISRQGGWQQVEADHLILATGAYEFVSPFPGWTLPGVMTTGGAQLMVKTMRVLPGRRALVAGSGPFLYVVANQLHSTGVEVVGVVEAIRRRDALAHFPSLLSQWGLFREGMACIGQLRRANIPIHWGHTVTEAHGDNSVAEVVVSPCDSQWHPLREKQQSFNVDTLCMGFGFIPRVDLAQMAGCRMRYEDILGGWIPDVDEHFQSSVPGVWVAGDGGGVAGALVAELEGTLTGLSVAKQLGHLDCPAIEAQKWPLERRLARLRRFRSALDHIYRVRQGLGDLATRDTIVCRCEELTREEVLTGVEFGGTDIRTLKVMTRLGMGPCQGKMCWPAVSRIVATQSGKTVEACGPLSVRPPASPLCIADLLGPPCVQDPAGADRQGETGSEKLSSNQLS